MIPAQGLASPRLGWRTRSLGSGGSGGAVLVRGGRRPFGGGMVRLLAVVEGGWGWVDVGNTGYGKYLVFDNGLGGGFWVEGARDAERGTW